MKDIILQSRGRKLYVNKGSFFLRADACLRIKEAFTKTETV